MLETMTKVKFFTIADYIEEEKWLEEMHRKGWSLVRSNVIFYTFKEAEPEEYIYKLDYKNKEMPRDYMQMFKDYGWEHCGYTLGWNYFRKPASKVAVKEEGEIFSDDKSKLEMIKHLMMTRLLPLLAIFLSILVPGIIRLGCPIYGRVKFIFMVYVLLLAIYTYVFFRIGIKVWQIRRKINDGQ